jgi:hypothetical protein
MISAAPTLYQFTDSTEIGDRISFNRDGIDLDREAAYQRAKCAARTLSLWLFATQMNGRPLTWVKIKSAVAATNLEAR